MISTVWGSTDKPISSKRLAALLSEVDDLEGTLYIGYPIIGTPDGSFPIDALFLSRQKGVVLIDLVEGRTVGNFAARQDEAYNKLHAKLLQHQSLIRKRELQVLPHTLTFAPAVVRLPEADDTEDALLCNAESLVQSIESLRDIESRYFGSLVSVIQAISNLRRGRKKRELAREDSRGAKIKGLEDSIANLDSQQSAAVVETFEGVQRIRGLAGCGKTVVLALKVAYLHARHPDWVIAVTFNTRSLKKQFETLITNFVLEQSNEEPVWENVRIMNAWGAPGGKDRTGIYYEFCRDHGIEYFDFGPAKERYGSDRAFEAVCELALSAGKAISPKFDAILVDEAQDFSPNFLQLCYEYLKDPKRLVYAYDELQNLGTKSLPPVEDIFGRNADGSPKVQLLPHEIGKARQDIILDTCYRNSGPLLATAHALGFGIYRHKGLVQIFENKSLWYDIGYQTAQPDIVDGAEVTLSRTPKSSPKFLERHSPVDDLIQFHVFEDAAQQTAWVVDQIAQNLQHDELIPDDIVVINPDPFTTKVQVGPIRAELLRRGINSNLAGVTTIADIFTEPGTVTFTGIFRAKGNEAAMVYVINAQDCFDARLARDVARIRNRLFTAITRSKAWVRVIGIGREMAGLKNEYEKAKGEDFSLRFRYPSEEERKTMQTVNRDMSKAEQERSSRRRGYLAEILESLDSGESILEDYPEDLVRRLEAALAKRNAAKAKASRRGGGRK